MFAYYRISFLIGILPIELINDILSYICSSLVVFATNNALHYINPQDNALIKFIPLNKIIGLNSNNNKFAISEDGLTFYRIYRRHMELEYLCDEVPDINKPLNKKTDGNRYYYSYNITKKCKVSSPVHKFISNHWRPSNLIHLSGNGKYIVVFAGKDNVIDKSNSYIALYNAKTKTLINEINIDDEHIKAVSISPDNSIVIVISEGLGFNNLWMWNIKNKKIYMQKFPINMKFNKLTQQIAWNHSSSKFAILFDLFDDNETPIGTRIVFGDFGHTCHFDKIKHINYILWINDERIACYDGNGTVFIHKWNNLNDAYNVHVSLNIGGRLKSSFDGHLIVINKDNNDYSYSNEDDWDNHTTNAENWIPFPKLTGTNWDEPYGKDYKQYTVDQLFPKVVNSSFVNIISIN